MVDSTLNFYPLSCGGGDGLLPSATLALGDVFVFPSLLSRAHPPLGKEPSLLKAIILIRRPQGQGPPWGHGEAGRLVPSPLALVPAVPFAQFIALERLRFQGGPRLCLPLALAANV